MAEQFGIRSPESYPLPIEPALAPYAPPATDFVAILRYWADTTPEGTAFAFLTDGEREQSRLTYRQLDERARAIAARLAAAGLRGERVMLLFPPGLDFVEAFFGCLYAGSVAVPAYPPKRNRNALRIEAISDDADAAAALTISEVSDRIGPVLEEAPHLQRLKWIASNQIETALAAEWDGFRPPAEQLAFLQYTSGSTGTPKGVMISHENMAYNVMMIAEGFEPDRDGLGVTWLPTYHDMGLIGSVLKPVFLGRPCVQMSPLAFLQKPVRWLQAISRYRATISGGPNFAYQLCVDKVADEDLAEVDLSSWKVAYNGAEPVRTETLTAFRERFAPFGFHAEANYPCYGMAETTLLVTGGSACEAPRIKSVDRRRLEAKRIATPVAENGVARELVSCGWPRGRSEVKIVDPDTMLPLDEDRVGEIWVAGPSVGLGYWNAPEATRQSFQAVLNGAGPRYLRTGDLGFLSGGELYVTGRLKDMVIVRGVNRYPQDIETTVEAASDGLRAGGVAAFSAEVEERERLVVVAELERGRKGDGHAIIEEIRRAITVEHELPPDAIVLVRSHSVPVTSSNKIQRHACRDAFLDGSLKVVEQWIGWEAAAHPLPTIARNGVHGHANGNGNGSHVPNGRHGVAAGPKPVVVDLVMKHVRDVARERAVTLDVDTNIVELGLDSLERLEIANRIEDSFGGRFPEAVLREIETIRDVALAVEEHIGVEPQAPVRPQDYETPEEHYRFEKTPAYTQLRGMLDMAAAMGIDNPYFTLHESVTADTTQIDGQSYINFSSYNYLGMSGDPIVTRAAQEAIAQYGSSVSASRLVSGEKPVHRALEQAIADFLGVEASISMVGGHATNETVIGHLLGARDLILHDALAHNSILQGAILSGARRRGFAHNDWEQLDQILTQVRHQYEKVLIAIEGVYSMDGDFPDLPKFVEIKKKHKALLMVDEAHSLGTMGRHGRGIGEHFDVHPGDVDIWMGTMSKSLGSCGGYIAGSQALVDLLKYTAPGFVYSVGMPPSAAAAALESLRQIERDPRRVAVLQARSALFLRLARERGMCTGMSAGTPVIPVIIGNSEHCLLLSRALRDRGVNVQPILYPAVEESASRLRFFITCRHTEAQIRHTVDAVAEELAKIDSRYAAPTVSATASSTN